MATTTTIIISASDNNDNEVNLTIPNINSNATDANLFSLASYLLNLSYYSLSVVTRNSFTSKIITN